MVVNCCGRRTLAALALFLAVLCLAGCGSGGRVPIQGSIAYDGTPVEEGTITFLALDGGGVDSNAGGDIKDGKYSINAERGPKPGKYKVEVYWNKKTGKMVATPGDSSVKMPETKQMLPPKYNKQTELTADITSGRNTKNFDLKR